MAWIIDVDMMADPAAKPGTNANAVGKRSSKTIDESSLVHKFRMLDDDEEVYYEGRSDDMSFAPKDDFGEPNAGCTTIQYWQPGKGGGWKPL